MVEVKIATLLIDQTGHIVLLKELSGDRVLPIWIGEAEARAIAGEVQDQKYKRPLSHDLLEMLLDTLEATVIKVEVSNLVDSTYYAQLYLQRENRIVKVDARPSDSIIMALKTHAPIFVAGALLERVEGIQIEDIEESGESLKDRVQRINPEDFGNFKL